MKPKDKAIDLVRDMEFEIPYVHDPTEPQSNDIAKKCALIAVDEVRWFHERLFYLTEGSLFDKYLDDVKQEIEKL